MVTVAPDLFQDIFRNVISLVFVFPLEMAFSPYFPSGRMIPLTRILPYFLARLKIRASLGYSSSLRNQGFPYTCGDKIRALLKACRTRSSSQ
jgi:hypothetical protein